MQKSTLFEIIADFDRKEYKYIRNWLQSPVHNKRRDVRDLFDWMVKWQGTAPTKEEIYQLLYPKTEYDDARMRQVMFFLQKEIESYLIHQAVSEDELFSLRTLAHVYQKKKLAKPFVKTLSKAKRQLEKYPYRNRHHLSMEHLLLQEEYNFVSARGRFQELNLQSLSDTLERNFLAEKLRHACMMSAHVRVFKKDYDFGLLEASLEYVEKRKWLNHPAISLYYYSYRALTETDRHWFDLLLQDMKKWKSVLPHDEEHEILLLAINFCIGKINEGDKSYYQQVLPLYRQGVEEGVLLMNGQISRYTFINIVSAALHEKDYDWAEVLISQYGHLLEERFRESTVNLSLISLFYARKKYRKAMELINETVFDDILMGLFAKSFLAKIYYELGEDVALESFIDSFLTYLRRKEVMAYHRKIYKTFALTLKKIQRLNWEDKQEQAKLRQQIIDLDKVAERDWLLKQLS
ncbi:MAG TPA: hypothetical protein ENK85_05420 [Saprospiraceae bacterium]|nr:hypothetical protein [Saprospiraceae bacterium]